MDRSSSSSSIANCNISVAASLVPLGKNNGEDGGALPLFPSFFPLFPPFLPPFARRLRAQAGLRPANGEILVGWDMG